MSFKDGKKINKGNAREIVKEKGKSEIIKEKGRLKFKINAK
jgi:hypothetical protein